MINVTNDMVVFRIDDITTDTDIIQSQLKLLVWENIQTVKIYIDLEYITVR